MPGRNCVVRGCYNTPATPNISFFGFPKDLKIRKLWVKFVKVRRSDFTVNSHGVHCKICSDHFAESAYLRGTVKLGANIGPKYRACLLKTAVPTIQLGCSTKPIKQRLFSENRLRSKVGISIYFFHSTSWVLKYQKETLKKVPGPGPASDPRRDRTTRNLTSCFVALYYY